MHDLAVSINFDEKYDYKMEQEILSGKKFQKVRHSLKDPTNTRSHFICFTDQILSIYN